MISVLRSEKYIMFYDKLNQNGFNILDIMPPANQPAKLEAWLKVIHNNFDSYYFAFSNISSSSKAMEVFSSYDITTEFQKLAIQAAMHRQDILYSKEMQESIKNKKEWWLEDWRKSTQDEILSAAEQFPKDFEEFKKELKIISKINQNSMSPENLELLNPWNIEPLKLTEAQNQKINKMLKNLKKYELEQQEETFKRGLDI